MFDHQLYFLDTHSRGAAVGLDGDGQVGTVNKARVVVVDVGSQRELGQGHGGDTGLGAVETTDAASRGARLDVLLGEVALGTGPEATGLPGVRDRDDARSLRGKLPASLGSIATGRSLTGVASERCWPNGEGAVVVNGEAASEGLARKQGRSQSSEEWGEVHGERDLL